VVGSRAAPGGQVLAFEDGAVRVFVDPKSFIYLDGSTLEYQTTMMGRGFKFTNPNAKGTCGCGESVQF
jgi:iron-sulfur cluster assembly protein